MINIIMKRNNIYKIIFVLFVTLVLPSFSSFAQNALMGPNTPDENGLYQNKSVTEFNYNTFEGKLTIQAFVTGEMSESLSAADLILVLDLSSSMKSEGISNLKTACLNVIENVSNSAQSNIGIIGYGRYAYDISGGLVNAKDNKAALDAAINSITWTNEASGSVYIGETKVVDATYPDEGMAMAKSWYSSSTSTNDKYVLFFTDGKPNGCMQAKNAVNHSLDLKNGSVTVFSIGMMEGDLKRTYININGGGSNYSEYKVYEFLTRISSEYLSAKDNSTLMSTPGGEQWNKNFQNWNDENPDGKQYFYQIGVDDIFSVFNNIVQEIVPESHSELSINSAIKDELSLACNFPDDFTEDDIKVYTADCENIIDGQYYFGEKEVDPTIDIELDGKMIYISNFDYSANCCLFNTTANIFQGKKIIVEFPFIISDLTNAENPLQTNTESSGIYKDKEEEEMAKMNFTIPEIYFIDLRISCTGLHAGESAIFKVDKLIDGIYTTRYIIPVIGTSDDGTVVYSTIAFAQPESTYKVTMTNWNWTYTTSENSIEKTSSDDDLDNTKMHTFDFTVEKDGLITTKNKEHLIINEFRD